MAPVRATPEMIEKALAEVDWARIDAMTDADIRRQIEADPDCAREMTEVDLKILFTPQVQAEISYKVKLLRSTLGMSQAEFGRSFGIPPATIRNWEQGIRSPDQASISVLRLIANDPERARQVLAGS